MHVFSSIRCSDEPCYPRKPRPIQTVAYTLTSAAVLPRCGVQIKIWSTKSLTDDSSGSEHSGGEEEEEEAKLDADSSQPSATGDSPTAAASGLMASRMMGPAKVGGLKVDRHTMTSRALTRPLL